MVIRRVLVGFDGSDGALGALAWGVTEARLRSVALVAYAVLGGDAPVPSPVPNPVTRGESEDFLGILRQAVQDRTEGYPAAFRYGLGNAAAQLISVCEEDDLLVVGSRGRNPFAGLLLGSVSRSCLGHAPYSHRVHGGRSIHRDDLPLTAFLQTIHSGAKSAARR